MPSRVAAAGSSRNRRRIYSSEVNAMAPAQIYDFIKSSPPLFASPDGEMMETVFGYRLTFPRPRHIIPSVMTELLIKKLSPHAHPPERAKEGDLGYDLFCSERTVIPAGKTIAVPTGIAVQFPHGWGAVIKDRSSMAMRQVMVSAGVIDNGYRGEIKVAMTNHSGVEIIMETGQKIAQMIPVPVTGWLVREVDQLSGSERGEGGFGSTGSHGPAGK